MKLIDKSALVAEIESKRKYAQVLGDNAINSSMQQFYDGMKQGCVDLLSFIDTFEAKEVDLEKELNDFIEEQKAWVKDDWVVEYNNGDSFNHIYDLELVAKHFFELGINKAQKGE